MKQFFSDSLTDSFDIITTFEDPVLDLNDIYAIL